MTRLLRSLFSDKPTDPGENPGEAARIEEASPEQSVESVVSNPDVTFNTMSPFNNQYAGRLPTKTLLPHPDTNSNVNRARQ